ncbi:hypothetical protein HPP92_021342 [Vanilla planifolia]|uniref:Transmembrane 9 superfamily member n=1 Tax=Vanilla planifolia TaxID=51239 RepID=A0A835UKM4_VANPL|nr:hypothetical protein HPP92_021342 [Vanilla planifolia]
MYQVNLILDNLPAIRYTTKEDLVHHWTGYPIGVNLRDSYFIFNHLKFTVLVHKYEEPATVAAASATSVGDTSAFRGDRDGPGYMVVGFEVVPCSFPHDAESIKNLKPREKYPTKIQCEPTTVSMELKEKQPLVFTYEVSFVESDIRWPSRWDAYLKMEGAKVHWFSILNSLMVIAFLCGHCFELDKEAQAQMNEELSGWKLVVSDVFRAPSNPTLLCVMVGDGVQILGMAVVTILFAALGFMSPASRGALVTGMLFIYLVLELQLVTQQFGFGRPSSGYFRAKAPHIEFPVRTNQILEKSLQKYPSWLLVLGAWDAAIWYSLHRTLLHHVKLVDGSGSVAIYISFTLNYLVFDLKSLSGSISATLYIGYSLFMVLAIMLATGTVGFLSSFWFVHYLFSSVKLD